MRVRRHPSSHELRGLPLDSCDMFLLSRLEHSLSLVQLAEVAPCELPEAMERVRALVELGVLELFFDEDAEQLELARGRKEDHQAVVAARVLSTPPANQQTVGKEEDPPTGLRPKPVLEAAKRSRVLLGAILLGRTRPVRPVEQDATSARVQEKGAAR